MDDQICAVEDRLMQILSATDLDFEVVEHAPVYTVEDAMAAVPNLVGIQTKNVFLRDAKGSRHILVVVPHDRRIDLLELARMLPSTKLSMGSSDRLQRYLGVTPGAVSVFCVMNDIDCAVELVVDEAVWHAARVQAHPLRNTATVSISHASMAVFLQHVGHRPIIMRVP